MIDIWTDAVIKEISYSSAEISSQTKVDTIFFGGGTPSLTPTNNLEQIFNKLHGSFSISKNVEITLEANPDTLTKTKIKAWKKLGINRVSLGVQSSDQSVLQTLDRAHSPENVKKTVELLREEELNNFSLDLIYGTPGESIDSWKRSVDSLIELAPPHISAYALTVEPGTALYRKVKNKEINNINSDDQADKYLIADAIFERNNLPWYEISNWATPGFECRHNLLYWKNQNWWGYGPGAHSHINGKRWWNVKHPAQYASKLAEGKSAVADYEQLNSEQQDLERVMLSMRLRETNLGETIPEYILHDWNEKGYLTTDKIKWELTAEGRLLLDTLINQVTT